MPSLKPSRLRAWSGAPPCSTVRAGPLLEAVDQPAQRPASRACRASGSAARGGSPPRRWRRSGAAGRRGSSSASIRSLRKSGIGTSWRGLRSARPKRSSNRRRAERDRDRQVGRPDRRAEDAALGRRVQRSRPASGRARRSAARLRAVSSASVVARPALAADDRVEASAKIAAVCGCAGRSMPAWCGPSNGMRPGAVPGAWARRRASRRAPPPGETCRRRRRPRRRPRRGGDRRGSPRGARGHLASLHQRPWVRPLRPPGRARPAARTAAPRGWPGRPASPEVGRR